MFEVGILSYRNPFFLGTMKYAASVYDLFFLMQKGVSLHQNLRPLVLVPSMKDTLAITGYIYESILMAQLKQLLYVQTLVFTPILFNLMNP